MVGARYGHSSLSTLSSHQTPACSSSRFSLLVDQSPVSVRGFVPGQCSTAHGWSRLSALACLHAFPGGPVGEVYPGWVIGSSSRTHGLSFILKPQPVSTSWRRTTTLEAVAAAERGGAGGGGGGVASVSSSRSSSSSPRTEFCSVLWSRSCRVFRVGQGSTALRVAGPRSVGLVAPFSDVIKFVAQSYLETRKLFLRAPCSGRHMPPCLRQPTKVSEEVLADFHVKVHTIIAVDSPFALKAGIISTSVHLAPDASV